MKDMSSTIIPKSDQLNADSLLGGPLTITITNIEIRPGTEQPVSVFFEGDNGKPWKPCKSMCRLMVMCWGRDAKLYIGRSMTIYSDPKVTWGGMAVGGIRISHISHIDESRTFALTATKGSKKAYTVNPLSLTSKATVQKIGEEEAHALDQRAIAAANAGKDAFREFYKNLNAAERESIKPKIDQYQKLSEKSDAAINGSADPFVDPPTEEKSNPSSTPEIII